MSINQVGWQLSEGTRVLRNFMEMLREVTVALQLITTTRMVLEDVGFWIDQQRFWVGLYTEEPDQIYFETNRRIDAEAASRLSDGTVEDSRTAPGKKKWVRAKRLDSEEVHFFSRSKIGQIKWLETFLSGSLEMAKSIEIQDPEPMALSED